MSPQEVAWRMRSTLRDTVDRWRLPRLRRRPTAAAGQGFQPGFEATDLPLGCGSGAAEPADPGLLAQADQIAAGRWCFFDQKPCHLGLPIDWNRDHGHCKNAPQHFAAAIDYRDFATVGDAKYVWEPNRHHQLVVLGRAYRASGDERYADAVAQQLASWLEQCPFGTGMNWRSPLELAVRLINWVWALDLIRPSGRPDPALRAELLNSVALHLWDITRKYSRGSSANNHRIGEAAGVFIAASYFPELKNARTWAEEAREILCAEIQSQTYPDGASREQALGYQAFVMQFFTLAGLVGRRTGTEFPTAYWHRLERMFEFGAALLEGGDPPPLFGDYDDGYVLDLGRSAGDLRAWLPVAAILFGRGDFKAAAGEYSECARWLLGRAGETAYAELPLANPSRPLASRAFADAGHYLLQSGQPADPSRISVLFDCGELGFGPLAAHGHADALSFVLRAGGVDVLVDPGTYDYFTHPAWRRHFRSTRAHNTVEVDGVDQSVMTGPFMWGARARAKCLLWQPGAQGGVVLGEHDGYARLPDPVIHRRKLELDGPQRVLTVEDDIQARESHEIAVWFHFAEHCSVRQVGPQQVEAKLARGRVTLTLDPRLEVSLLHGSEQPIAGWVSRGYHHRAPATSVGGRCVTEGSVRLLSRVEVA
jgi:hypothetical protein